MHANITTWLISDVARKSANVQEFLQNWEPSSYRQFFQQTAPQIVPVLQTHGLIQSFAIRTRADVVTIVSIFRDEAGAEAAWSEISGGLHALMDGTLEFLEFSSGPVEDLIQLGCGVRWPER
jgi:hypothetical protein